MTANAYQEEFSRSRAIGMNGYLSKPIDLVVVMRTLDELLGRA